jgi:hypothetical protein
MNIHWSMGGAKEKGIKMEGDSFRDSLRRNAMLNANVYEFLIVERTTLSKLTINYLNRFFQSLIHRNFHGFVALN